MIQNLYCVKDELSDFGSPVPLQNDEIAKRYLKQLVENTDLIKNNPKDFSIWMVGQFNTETGYVQGLDLSQIHLVERAENYV